MARVEIPWFEWYYSISDDWEVQSKDRIIMRSNWIKQTFKKRIIYNKPWKNWYHYVSLWKEWKAYRFLVHRLVYCCFNWIDLRFKWYNTKTLVCHKDDNPSNNNLNNLFIGTQTDNMWDCVKKWRQSRWEKNWRSKLQNGQINRIKLMLDIWKISQRKIWKFFWVWQDHISRIKTWKCWNFIS